LNAFCHGMLFSEPSQNSSRLGSLPAALQMLVTMRSIEPPSNRRAPPGSRVLKFSSTLLYDRFLDHRFVVVRHRRAVTHRPG
jgi:hypothetical protein